MVLSGSFSNDWSLHLISKEEVSLPLEKAHFHCLCLWSCSFGYYSKLVTIGEVSDIHRAVTQQLCFSAFSSPGQTGTASTSPQLWLQTNYKDIKGRPGPRCYTCCWLISIIDLQQDNKLRGRQGTDTIHCSNVWQSNPGEIWKDFYGSHLIPNFPAK